MLAGDLLARLWDWLGPAWQPRSLIVLVALALILAAPILWHAVEYKSVLLRQPLLSDADKHAVVGR